MLAPLEAVAFGAGAAESWPAGCRLRTSASGVAVLLVLLPILTLSGPRMGSRRTVGSDRDVSADVGAVSPDDRVSPA